MDVLVGAVQPDLALGEAPHPGAHGGCVLGPHAGVGDDHRVGGEPVGALLDEGAEVRRAGLLLALDQQLEVDGRSGTAGRGEVGADPECVEEHLALVVGGAPREEPVAAYDGLEGVGVPAVLAGGGLDVVVAVDQHGGGLGVVRGPFGVHGRGARGGPDLGHREARPGEFRGEPVGAAPDIGGVFRLGGHGRDAQPRGEVVEKGSAVSFDVRVDGAVRGRAHAHEPIGPHGHPRRAVRHTRPSLSPRFVPLRAVAPAPPARAARPGGRPRRCARTGTRR